MASLATLPFKVEVPSNAKNAEPSNRIKAALLSFPRKRESNVGVRTAVDSVMPAFAGMTEFVN